MHYGRRLEIFWRGGVKFFPHRNVCSSQSYVSREQRRPCSGLAQARLTFGSGLLRYAYPRYVTRRSGAAKNNLTRKTSTFDEGPEKAPPLARDLKYVTTSIMLTDTGDYNPGKMLSSPCSKNGVSSRLCNFPSSSSLPSSLPSPLPSSLPSPLLSSLAPIASNYDGDSE